MKSKLYSVRALLSYLVIGAAVIVSGCNEKDTLSPDVPVSLKAACNPTINPFVQINGGAWQNTSTASVASGGSVKFGPQPTSGGSWKWTGPNGFSATTREVTISNIQTSQAGNYVATYSNTGCSSTNTFKVTVTGAPPCGTSTFQSAPYFYQPNAWGGGGYCTWFTSVNSWGANANVNSTSIVGYPSIVRGCHWSACSSNSGLPKLLSAIGSVTTSWTQSSSGAAWDAAYDIWFDPAAVPGNRAATYELMVWLQWTGTQPIAATYDASGNAIPFASNVSVGGRTFNVYRRDNVFSFLLTSQSKSISFTLKPLADYCVARGWMPSTVNLISIEAGWEIIKGGTYSTSAFSVSGL